jgi:SulP family sulfate permease
MRFVPLLDASGVTALEEFVVQAKLTGAQIILSGVQAQPASMLARVRLGPDTDQLRYAPNFQAALRIAETLTGGA